jgi:hypothetical protein
MTSELYNNEESSEDREPLDRFATILFMVFGFCLGYLVVARSFGFYPWALLVDVIAFIPMWEAVITFNGILVIMFATLIGGLIRMRYSIILIGIVTLVAVFIVTFYSLYLAGWLIALPLP